jgi:biotin carboxylase
MSAGHRVAVVVDPYSSGNMLAPELRAAGLSPVAVLSSGSPPAAYAASYRPGDFDAVLPGDVPVDELAARLRGLDPLFVVPGTEPGVELADALAARLTPHLANVPELADARRHKAAMAAAVAAAGLPVPRQVCTDDPAEVEAWVAAEGLAGRALVLKPPKSAGTDGVVRVGPGDDWRPAFHALLGRRNKLDGIDDRVLVQEHLEGDEFVVDTYSVDGHHVVTDVCRYRKVANVDHVAVYDSMEFLADDPTPGRALVAYTFAVLDALGIRNGPAHTEVMLTADGPRHIETGARMHGGGHPEFCRLATGDSQLDRMVAHLAGTGPVGGDYRLRRTVLVVFLIARRAGVVANAEVLERAAALPTHYRSVLPVVTGDTVAETSDLFTALGFVVLASERRDDVIRDYEAAKALERAVEISPALALAGRP